MTDSLYQYCRYNSSTNTSRHIGSAFGLIYFSICVLFKMSSLILELIIHTRLHEPFVLTQHSEILRRISPSAISALLSSISLGLKHKPDALQEKQWGKTHQSWVINHLIVLISFFYATATMPSSVLLFLLSERGSPSAVLQQRYMDTSWLAATQWNRCSARLRCWTWYTHAFFVLVSHIQLLYTCMQRRGKQTQHSHPRYCWFMLMWAGRAL